MVSIFTWSVYREACHFVVLAERRAAFPCGRRGKANEEACRRFLAKTGVQVMYADERTIDHYAAVYAQLRHQGTSISTHHLWIAALTLQHGLALYSRDAHTSIGWTLQRA